MLICVNACYKDTIVSVSIVSRKVTLQLNQKNYYIQKSQTNENYYLCILPFFKHEHGRTDGKKQITKKRKCYW